MRTVSVRALQLFPKKLCSASRTANRSSAVGGGTITNLRWNILAYLCFKH